MKPLLNVLRLGIIVVLASCSIPARQSAVQFLPASQRVGQIKLPRATHVVPFFDFGGGKSDSLGSGGFGGLTITSDGTIYAAASYGGDPSCNGIGSQFNIAGCGLVFALKPNSTGSTYSETVLHVFKGGNDGNSPHTGLLQVGRNFFGETIYGGGGCPYVSASGCGAVYEMTPRGKVTIVYAFNLTDGGLPDGNLVADSHGNLFGATFDGGAGVGSGSFGCGYSGCGVVFELARTGSSYNYKILYAFQGTKNDGSLPLYLLLRNGAIFGTAYGGNNSIACYGSAPCGTAFELAPQSGGTYRFVLLHAFAGGEDGSAPDRLVAGPDGVFYGSTKLGGGRDCGAQTVDGGCGIVYSLSLAKNGSYVERIIHRFGTFADGQYPANIIYYNGKIYGVTAGGRDEPYCLSPNGEGGHTPRREGCGTVFTVNPYGRDFQILYRFHGQSDGYWPLAGLTVSNGRLYGTTLLGGKFGFGTGYKVTP